MTQAGAMNRQGSCAVVEAQSGLSEAKTEVQARARMHRATGRATKLAAQSGREQFRQW